MAGNFGRALACAALLGTLALAGPAAATHLIYVTYTGTATGIQDPNGLFGAPQMNFSASYVDRYVFDLDVGLRNTTATYDQLLGGSTWGTATPALDSALTINGHTVHFSGGATGQQFNQLGSFTESYAIQFDALGRWTMNFNNIHVGAPLALGTPFSASGTGSGNFFICNFQPGGCKPEPAILQGRLSPDTVTVSVPEPGVWTLMILGLASLGAALRRRRVGYRVA